MRTRGGERLRSGGAGRWFVVALSCAGGIAASQLATLGSGQNWTSQVTQSIVASASAHGVSRRSPEKAVEDLRRAEQFRKRTQQLQQNEEMQQRVRNIQNLLAVQQKRLQLQQQIEEAQKKIQQTQQQTEAMQKRLQVMRAHTPHGPIGHPAQGADAAAADARDLEARARDARSASQQAAAVGGEQPRVQAAAADAPSDVAAAGDVALAAPTPYRHRTFFAWSVRDHAAGSIGHHHSVLLATMARIRTSYPHGHGLLQGGHHHFQPLQHAIYHRMFHKLSHIIGETGRRSSRRRLQRPRRQRAPRRVRALAYRWTASETRQRQAKTT